MDNCYLVQAENLAKEYGTSVITRALDEVSFKLSCGDFVSIIGQSGCGKSTLLNMLGALDRPTRGRILFRDKDIFQLNDVQLAEFRNRSIGFIFQFHHLLPEFTALENVMIPHWIESGIANRKKEERAKELLELVGLKDRINNLATNLSGGQQQRVSIARALINNPDLILADEPTGNLDSDSTDQVYELLRNVNRDLGISFLIVTHDRNIAEKSDRVIEMKDGRIINDHRTDEKLPEELWHSLAPQNLRT